MKSLRVLYSRKIFSNGSHNAFTTIASCGDALFIAFRTGVGHLVPDGTINVLKSTDSGKNWDLCANIALEGWDLRDPNLIFFEDQLHLFCFGRKTDCVSTHNSFHCRLMPDGSFSAPEKLNDMPILWGIAAFGNKLYGTAYHTCPDRGCRVTLHSSSDGLNWEELKELPFPGNEAAIDFDPDGTMWLLVRDTHDCRCYGGGSIPVLCKLEPPYTSERFPSYPMALRIQGPMLKRINGATIIAGRRWDGWERNRRNLRTDLFLIADGEDVRFISTLPSGGDTSYASCLELPGNRMLLAYYSSHEHRMDVPFEEDDPKDPAKAEHSTPADIFLAEISRNF